MVGERPTHWYTSENPGRDLLNIRLAAAQANAAKNGMNDYRAEGIRRIEHAIYLLFLRESENRA